MTAEEQARVNAHGPNAETSAGAVGAMAEAQRRIMIEKMAATPLKPHVTNPNATGRAK